VATEVLKAVETLWLQAAQGGWLNYDGNSVPNTNPFHLISILQNIKAKNIHVGDLVRVVSDADVPCDLVLLSSSQSDGRCYITTANLDGETNLKVWWH